MCISSLWHTKSEIVSTVSYISAMLISQLYFLWESKNTIQCGKCMTHKTLVVIPMWNNEWNNTYYFRLCFMYMYVHNFIHIGAYEQWMQKEASNCIDFNFIQKTYHIKKFRWACMWSVIHIYITKQLDSLVTLVVLQLDAPSWLHHL